LSLEEVEVEVEDDIREMSSPLSLPLMLLRAE
jgi:hypothetical protein